MSDSRPPRIAWFSPLRPVESGISLYNEELLPVLARAWRIDVYVDDYTPSHLSATETLRIRPAKAFRDAQRSAPYDAVVYQMGNSPAHAYMYRTALEIPGLLVLHDTVLHHLLLAMLLRARRAGEYRALMERRYGATGREVAGRVMRGQLAASLFDFPLSEDQVEAARLVAVHSQFSRARVLGRSPGAPTTVIPMGIRLPALISREEARRRLSLPDDQFIIASVTRVNPYKRIDVVLRALRSLRQFRPARLLVAGTVSPMVPLGRMVALLGLEQAVDLLGFVNDDTARLVVAAADVCVNLRYPTAGETSASLLRLMGAGRPVLVTDAGSFAEMPDGAVVKTRPDALEEEMVFEFFRQLAERPALRDALGRNARAFIIRQHGIPAMVAGYHAALQGVAGRELPLPPAEVEIEPFTSPIHPPPRDPLLEEVAAAIVELGLGSDERLTWSAARAAADLGLSPDKMDAEDRTDHGARRGEPGERRGAEADQR